MTHEETIRREFGKQAATFEDPSYSFRDRHLMSWIREHVPCEAGAAVLDVAGGTGIVARAYADVAEVAVVLDLTEEMLRVGKRESEAAGSSNVLFVLGDAARMPFLADSFDLVLSRFAVHHFEEPARPIAEMARVCRPGGRVAIVDLVTAEEALETDYNRLERIRDPSHARALPVPELRRLMQEAGTSIEEEVTHDQPVSVDRWLAQAQTPAETGHAIRGELEAELAGGAPTGMRPLTHAGELRFTQRWATVVGRRRPEGQR